MRIQSFPRVPKADQHSANPLCSMCNKPVPLENSKTEENGLAIHEDCYFLNIESPPRYQRRFLLRSDISFYPGIFDRKSPHTSTPTEKRGRYMTLMTALLKRFWCEDEGQDIAEYAVMLAVILVIVVGTVRLVGSNSNNAFSSVASSLQ
jgi:Flp pilus assembly pilin Flp